MINQILTQMAGYMDTNLWLAPIVCLLAGILTSLMPCSLSTIPLVIGYVSSSAVSDWKKAFRFSLVFVIGMSITYTALGATAALAGKLIGSANRYFYLFLGVLMILMALQTWEIYTFIPASYLTAKNTKKGYAGAFISGVLGGIFSSACATPVLVVILSLVAKSASPVRGVVYLLLFSIGNGFLVVVAGTSVGLVRKISQSPSYERFHVLLKIFMGGAILLIGLYMLYWGF